jgi:hypothetical protein
MKSVIVRENDKYKDWGINEDMNEANSQYVINIKQAIIDEHEIKDGFPKKL